MKSFGFKLFFIKLLFVLAFLDYSGDFLIIPESGIFKLIEILIRQAFIFVLLLLSIWSLKIGLCVGISRAAVIVLSPLLAALIYGFLVGVASNEPRDAVREIIAVTPILLIPMLLQLELKHKLEIFRFAIYTLIIVAGLKIVLAQLVTIAIYGSLSWKVFLKISPLLLLPLVYFLYLSVNSKNSKYNYLIVGVIIIEILSAQARTLTAASLLGLGIILLRPSKIYQLIALVLITFFVGFIFSISTDISISESFGLWSGEHFDNSSNYRKEQLELLINRFFDKPIVGYGFGFYTEGYNTYELLDIPFQLELDLVNFATKTGLIVFLIYCSSYIMIFLQLFKSRRKFAKEDIVLKTSLITILSLIFYSCFQTLHASVLYWIIFTLCFSMIFGYKTGAINNANHAN